MYTGTIAVRYAKALLKSACQNGEEKRVYEQIDEIYAKYLGDSSIRTILSAPVFSKTAKTGAIQQILNGGLCKSLTAFIELVINHNRGEYLIFMLFAYCRLYEKHCRTERATLTTASSIGDANIARITSLIMSKTDCNDVNIAFKKDESIIGGFVLQIGDCLIDASLSRQLKELGERLRNKRIV